MACTFCVHGSISCINSHPQRKHYLGGVVFALFETCHIESPIGESRGCPGKNGNPHYGGQPLPCHYPGTTLMNRRTKSTNLLQNSLYTLGIFSATLRKIVVVALPNWRNSFIYPTRMSTTSLPCQPIT